MKQIESDMQQALFRWASYRPELDTMHAIPNGGARDVRTGARMKREGVKRGIPDVCLPIPRDGYHGLYLELKAGYNQPTKEQRWMIERLADAGYSVHVCRSFEDACSVISIYMGWDV